MNSPPQGRHTGVGLGAYGLILKGLPGAAPWMQPQKSDAPTLAVEVLSDGDAFEHEPPVLTEEVADLPLLGGGRLQLQRSQSVARYFLEAKPSDEDLLHPYVAPAAALFWQWSGREAIHAGAFESGQGAVLVLGDKEAGKSTTLGWLAIEGATTVLTDDLAIMDANMVQAGPRSIDLRVTEEISDLAAHVVRNGERQRLRLPACPPALPLAGSVALEWGDRLELSPVGFSERMALIGAQRTFPGLAANAVAMLELGTAPMVRATRPRHLSSLADFAKALLDYFS
jgi:hypothetical protein